MGKGAWEYPALWTKLVFFWGNLVRLRAKEIYLVRDSVRLSLFFAAPTKL